ncbi:expressed unknown protein [Seminavis robusta]|uniref:ZZ-type domain-containing protein n=1 Tax=Seminavis robusta TaxID=568900 RepID=A0A9N8DZT5_9STRA|nr:expressed unknown protein [Seminavis robusta]|eukprot:Sro506_g156390.1 n/a (420) ;mRNA; r:55112-56371
MSTSSAAASASAASTAATIPRQQHLNVSCDECGELPIVGTRFKSRVQPNYDVCQGCLDENHNGDTSGFEVLQVYRPSVAAIRSDTGGRSVAIHSLYDLEDTLLDATVEDVAFYVGTRLTCPTLGATVRRVLRETKSLKSVHIHIFGTELSTETIVALAEGLQYNTSAQSVSWNLLWNRTDPPLDDAAAHALQTLMETNTTIQYMFVHRQRGFVGTTTTTTSMDTTTTTQQDDPLANAIFAALAKTHLHTVRYSGTTLVSEHNKKRAWAAMIANPHLKRVKTKFVGEHDVSSQEYLELLQADKKHDCWLQRWTGMTQLGASKEETKQSQQRWNVLKEVLDAKQQVDKVPVLYHLLRNQPECLLQVNLDLPLWTPEDDEQEDVVVTEANASNNNNKRRDVFMMDVSGLVDDEDTYENLIWV